MENTNSFNKLLLCSFIAGISIVTTLYYANEVKNERNAEIPSRQEIERAVTQYLKEYKSKNKDAAPMMRQ